MGHGGLLVSVSLRKVAVLSEPLVAASNFSPCLRTQTNEMIGGGDVHQSLYLPPFSSSIFARVPPPRPGFALERNGNVTAWWYQQQEGQSLILAWL